MRDLGIDNTAGKKRGKVAHNKRCRKGQGRAKRTSWMTKKYGKAKKIFATGALSQMMYQAKCIGGTQGEIRNMRKAAKTAAGSTIWGNVHHGEASVGIRPGARPRDQATARTNDGMGQILEE